MESRINVKTYRHWQKEPEVYEYRNTAGLDPAYHGLNQYRTDAVNHAANKTAVRILYVGGLFEAYIWFIIMYKV